MSYILDALRKSERERQAGQTPGLPHLITETRSRSPRGLIWVVVGLAVINLLGVGYWVWATWLRSPNAPETHIPDRAGRPESDEKSLDQAPVAAPIVTQPQPLPPTQVITPTAPPSTPQSRSATLPPPAPSLERPLNPMPMPSNSDDDFDEVDREMEEEGGGQRNAPVVLNRPHPGVRAGAPALRDLPPDFQSRIPSFRITMFAYTENPEDRFVIVNMKKVRAGEMLPGGVLLLEIQAENLLVEYDGQKFLIPRF